MTSVKDQYKDECRRLAVDARGAWQISPGWRLGGGDPPTLFAVAPDHAFVLRAFETPSLDVGLSPEAPLRLVVTCQAEPCTKWAFWLRAIPNVPGWPPGTELPSDGSFTIPGLAAGDYQLEASMNGRHANERHGEGRIELHAGSLTTLGLDLRRTGTGASISGHVRGGARRVRAECSGVTRTAHVRADGAFVIDDVGPGECTIEADDHESDDADDLVGCKPHPRAHAAAGATDVELRVCSGPPRQPHE